MRGRIWRALLAMILAGVFLSAEASADTKEICQHIWQNGGCLLCGDECPHTYGIRDGLCVVCGMPCTHLSYEDGVCVYCGYRCPHDMHTQAGSCIECGQAVAHTYSGNTCTICGAPFVFYDGIPDYGLWYPIEQKGTVEELTYASKRYGTDGSSVETQKKMAVYLPYGYSREQKYNLLVIIPGTDMYETSVLYDTHEYDEYVGDVSLVNLLDNMTAAGIVQPVIVANITYFGNTWGGTAEFGRDSNQVAKELREVILPLLAQRYSLYAEGSDEESLRQAREHMAVFGTSYGAMIVNGVLSAECRDLFSWFGSSSAFGNGNMAEAAAELRESSEYPVGYYYFGSGEYDRAREQSSDVYDLFVSEDGLVRKDNSANVIVGGAGHDAKAYYVAIYNCLRRFFT